MRVVPWFLLPVEEEDDPGLSPVDGSFEMGDLERIAPIRVQFGAPGNK